MKTAAEKLNKLWYTALLTFFAAALLPEYIAPVLMLVCFILVLKNRNQLPQKSHFGSVGTALLAFMAFMVVGITYSSGIVTSLASIALWTFMLCGFWFTYTVLDSQTKIQKMFFVGSVSSGIAGAIGILQMLLFHYGKYIAKGLDKFFNPFWHFLDIAFSKIVYILPQAAAEMLPKTKFNVFPTRACSTFTNPLFFAAFEVVMLPFSAYCFLCMKQKKYRIIGLVCFFISIGGIASSYSRGPYLAAAAVVVLLLLYGGKKALAIGTAGVGSAAVMMIFASGTVKRIFTLILSKNDISLNTRAQIWNAVFDMIKKRPVFGYGTGFDNVRQILHNVYRIKQPHAHNIIFEIWLENGIFGVILFAAILVIFTLNIIKLSKIGKEQRYIAVTLFASVGGFLLCGITDCLFYGFKPLQYFMIILGISQAVFTRYLKDKQIYLLPESARRKITSFFSKK